MNKQSWLLFFIFRWSNTNRRMTSKILLLVHDMMHDFDRHKVNILYTCHTDKVKNIFEEHLFLISFLNISTMHACFIVRLSTGSLVVSIYDYIYIYNAIKDEIYNMKY